jgi:hypothetical protein
MEIFYEEILFSKTNDIRKSLPLKWEAYKQTLIDVEEMLKKYKVLKICL